MERTLLKPVTITDFRTNNDYDGNAIEKESPRVEHESLPIISGAHKTPGSNNGQRGGI